MQQLNLVDAVRRQINSEMSDINAIACLLNCYIREYALANGEVTFNAELEDCPGALRQGAGRGQLVLLSLRESAARILVLADRVSRLGRCRFLGKPFLKKAGAGWLLLSADELCCLLLQHLALTSGTDFNGELFSQVKNSRDVTGEFLSRQLPMLRREDTFIRSEQSLLWGHALHPSPKSREGIPLDRLLACSPEVRASFQLYWFEVDDTLVRSEGGCNTATDETFSRLHSSGLGLYPCHPWEAEALLKEPLVQAAIGRGLLKPLGPLGEEVSPTSSVRTVYHAALDYQLKFSVRVRLTNCIRKNAWYELESAVALSRILGELAPRVQGICPAFALMLEPLSSTIDLGELAAELNLAGVERCRESFGILFRRNIPVLERAQFQPEVAAGLFAWNRRGESEIVMRLREIASERNAAYSAVAGEWFAHYVDALLPGICHYLFHYGVVFEPHLQNTVIGFRDGMPVRVWIRDLEGTKLLPEHWPAERLAGMSRRALESIYYSREKGWQRIAYCMLINNFSEAIFHLADGDPGLETALWQQLREAIAVGRGAWGSPAELDRLLDGEAIPSKNNFTTRVLKQADRMASYSRLPNPMAGAVA